MAQCECRNTTWGKGIPNDGTGPVINGYIISGISGGVDRAGQHKSGRCWNNFIQDIHEQHSRSGQGWTTQVRAGLDYTIRTLLGLQY